MGVAGRSESDVILIARGLTRTAAAQLWPAVAEIFFLSSEVRDFPSASARQSFLDAWTAYYRESEPEHIYLALSSSGALLGYVMGCRDSKAARRLYGDIASYRLFEDLFARYPAHLHVNCHPDHRGRGIGSDLVAAFVGDLARDGISGVHIVTAPGARNEAFYRRNGFTHALTRRWRDKDLLFLGRAISASDSGRADGSAQPRSGNTGAPR